MIRTWLIPNDPRRFSSWIKALHTGLVSILMTLCLASGAAGQSSDTSSGDDPTNVAAPPFPNPPRTLKDLPVIIPKQNTEKFEWRTATQEAWLYTGVMHAFRFVTEAGTRDTLNGSWFNDWMGSVSELRGWSDGDPFITNYVAHTLEGSIFGFIQQNNDPRYRNVMWASGRDYWISRLRALSFSAVMSTQWKIGPASEASLGNVQLHEPAGFVDFAVTPTFGICEMLGEDITDHYVITALENQTTNRVVLILARSFLNPSRTFANIMEFKEPWYRRTRVGLFRENYILRKKLLEEYRNGGTEPFEFVKNTPEDLERQLPLEAPIELMVSTQYETFLGGGSCIGGGGTGGFRIHPSWQIVGEFTGCLVINMPTN